MIKQLNVAPSKQYLSWSTSHVHTQGWPGPYIYTAYDCIFGDFPAKNTVYVPYTYGSGQPNAYMTMRMCFAFNCMQLQVLMCTAIALTLSTKHLSPNSRNRHASVQLANTHTCILASPASAARMLRLFPSSALLLIISRPVLKHTHTHILSNCVCRLQPYFCNSNALNHLLIIHLFTTHAQHLYATSFSSTPLTPTTPTSASESAASSSASAAAARCLACARGCWCVCV